VNLKQRQQRHQRIQARLARRQSRQAADQARFVGPYTPRQAGRVARAQTAVEYRPVERQISSEIRGSRKRETELGAAYGQLADRYAQQQQATQQAFDTAEQATTQRLSDAAKSGQATLQQIQASNADFAKLTGAPAPSDSGSATQAEIAAAAERMRAALVAPTTQMRASYAANTAPLAEAATLGGIEARDREAERRRKEQGDMQALRREKGQAVVKTIHAFREQDQNFSTQQQALGAKVGYNKALERQAQLGLASSKVTAAAQVAAAQAYSGARERGASAQEASANAYAAAKKRGASAQEATAAANLAAAKIKAKSNVSVAKQQGKNAAHGGGGGYTVPEASKLLKQAGAGLEGEGKTWGSPGEAVQYLVSRGVKEQVAKEAVHRVWRAANAGGGK
jgi:hypothetical protein